MLSASPPLYHKLNFLKNTSSSHTSQYEINTNIHIIGSEVYQTNAQYLENMVKSMVKHQKYLPIFYHPEVCKEAVHEFASLCYGSSGPDQQQGYTSNDTPVEDRFHIT